MPPRLWGSDWSWSSLEASSGDSDAKVSLGTGTKGEELDLEAAESSPLLPSFLRIPSSSDSIVRFDDASEESPLHTVEEGEERGQTAATAFAAFASRPQHDRPNSALRDPLTTKFSRKSVAFAEPSPRAEAAPRTYRWQRSGSSEPGGLGPRKSSLHHIDSDLESLLSEDTSCCARMKAAGLAMRHLGREVLSLYHALHDPRTPCVARFLPWLIIMFARSPLSPIPDFLPLFSMLNNLLLMPGLIWLAIHSVPVKIMDEARRRAAEGPVLLSRSWLTPVLIFLVWLGGLEGCLYAILHGWGSESVVESLWIILAAIAGISTTAFLLWLLSLDGDWELMLMYGVEYKEMSTLHWLEDAAPQVSHKRRAGKVYEGGPVTP